MSSASRRVALTAVAATVSLGAATAVWGAGAAGATPSTSRRTFIAHSSSVTEAPVTVGAPACEAKTCIVDTTHPFTSIGDQVGSGDGREAHWIDFTDPASGVVLHTSIYTIFRGTVAGCGTGTYASVSSGEVTIRPGQPFTVTSEIIEGSGTGDLVGIKGKGSIVSTVGADGRTHSEATMKISCRTGKG